MSLSPLTDEQILAAWHKNATAWTIAVRGGHIESRRLVTDRAMIDAICDRAPQTVLDLGCGEGWLARALAARGIEVMGVDGVPDLVEQAQAAGGGRFVVLSYEAIARHADNPMPLFNQTFDVAVSNFALLGHEAVSGLFAAMPSLLRPGGAFIIQTLHPWVACGEQPYQDGWRPGSWAGFSSDFTDPAPWYFRTLESWIGLYREHGLTLHEIREPIHPHTGRPASLVLIGTR